jgi:hypothetical protein
MDRARATRLGLLDVDCGETSNDFYARPSQLDEPSLVEVENLDVDPE